MEARRMNVSELRAELGRRGRISRGMRMELQDPLDDDMPTTGSEDAGLNLAEAEMATERRFSRVRSAGTGGVREEMEAMERNEEVVEAVDGEEDEMGEEETLVVEDDEHLPLERSSLAPPRSLQPRDCPAVMRGSRREVVDAHPAPEEEEGVEDTVVDRVVERREVEREGADRVVERREVGREVADRAVERREVERREVEGDEVMPRGELEGPDSRWNGLVRRSLAGGARVRPLSERACATAEVCGRNQASPRDCERNRQTSPRDCETTRRRLTCTEDARRSMRCAPAVADCCPTAPNRPCLPRTVGNVTVRERNTESTGVFCRSGPRSMCDSLPEVPGGPFCGQMRRQAVVHTDLHTGSACVPAARWNPCSFNCPSSTVTIQPPPFVLNIPGPTLTCPNEPPCIEQFNPCAPVPCQGGINPGGCGFYPEGPAPGSGCASIYSQSLPQNMSGFNPCQRF